MTESNTAEAEPDAETENNDVNISRLRELALRGAQFREQVDIDYYGETLELYVRPLKDIEFLPIAAVLEDRLNIDADEAQELMEEEKEETGSIDPANFDEDFVEIMQEAAVMGLDGSRGDAAGEDEAGLREIVTMLQGGKTLEIAERVLAISSDAGKAEKFRRDGGGE